MVNRNKKLRNLLSVIRIGEITEYFANNIFYPSINKIDGVEFLEKLDFVKNSIVADNNMNKVLGSYYLLNRDYIKHLNKLKHEQEKKHYEEVLKQIYNNSGLLKSNNTEISLEFSHSFIPETEFILFPFNYYPVLQFIYYSDVIKNYYGFKYKDTIPKELKFDNIVIKINLGNDNLTIESFFSLYITDKDVDFLYDISEIIIKNLKLIEKKYDVFSSGKDIGELFSKIRDYIFLYLLDKMYLSLKNNGYISYFSNEKCLDVVGELYSCSFKFPLKGNPSEYLNQENIERAIIEKDFPNYVYIEENDKVSLVLNKIIVNILDFMLRELKIDGDDEKLNKLKLLNKNCQFFGFENEIEMIFVSVINALSDIIVNYVISNLIKFYQENKDQYVFANRNYNEVKKLFPTIDLTIGQNELFLDIKNTINNYNDVLKRIEKDINSLLGNSEEEKKTEETKEIKTDKSQEGSDVQQTNDVPKPKIKKKIL